MTTDDPDLRWTAIGSIDDWKKNSGRLITVGARRLGVYRFEDTFYCCKDYCPHAGVSLVAAVQAEDSMSDATVTCMAHGWKFDLESGCMMGGHGDCKVATYPCRVVENAVEIGL